MLLKYLCILNYMINSIIIIFYLKLNNYLINNVFFYYRISNMLFFFLDMNK